MRFFFLFPLMVSGLTEPPRSVPEMEALPDALRGEASKWVSSGAYAALFAGTDFIQPGNSKRAKAMDLSAHLTGDPLIDIRIGPNVLIGDDDPVLPLNMRAQAEPHLIRSPLDPYFLLGTWQDGRFTDGGAVTCGYGISRDGGLTWERSIIPSLTTADGGLYDRASDPVAAIDHRGILYLNTLGINSGNQGIPAEIVVSRSADGGRSWSDPVVAVSPSVPGDFVDKNWIVANGLSGSPTAGRLVVTWTLFAVANRNQSISPIYSTFSDDGGLTWSAPLLVSTLNQGAQGSLPLFHADGSLSVVYYDYNSSTLWINHSPDGGESYNGPQAFQVINQLDVPNVRDGFILPNATIDPFSDTLYVAYQGLESGFPGIFLMRSDDKGLAWTQPVRVSEIPNSPNIYTFNPAVAVSPGSGQVLVMFYDTRNDPGTEFRFVDIYLSESTDEGETWSSDIRLTDQSTDISLSPLTSRGRMLGDYQAMVPALGPDLPAVPIWVDGRGTDPEPYAGTFYEYQWERFEPVGGTWRFQPWLGLIEDSNYPWVYHAEHGWIYSLQRGTRPMWFFDERLGWLWTSEFVYPYLFSDTESNWLYYFKGSSGPRYFYSFRDDAWKGY